MKRSAFAVLLAILVFATLPVTAQDDEERVSKYSFQGRVGAVFTGDEPFENGATFEVGGMYRLSGPVYLNFFAGTINFESDNAIRPISEDFALFWDNIQRDFNVFDMDDIRYRLNFGGVGLVMKMEAGRIEPYIVGGIGAYNTKFTATFSFVDKAVSQELQELFGTITSVEDSKTAIGWHVGGGLNYSLNQIISINGQVSYRDIDLDSFQNGLISMTFGLHVKIP